MIQYRISEAKMVVQLDIVERGKQKFNDSGIKKNSCVSWRWEWTEKMVGGEKLSLLMSN